MAWDLTLLVVHILAALVCATLYCTAPDWLQKLVLGLLIASSLILVSVYAADLGRLEQPWQIKVIALKVEHLAVLLYLFRLIFVERLSCKSSSQPSRHSAG